MKIRWKFSTREQVRWSACLLWLSPTLTVCCDWVQPLLAPHIPRPGQCAPYTLRARIDKQSECCKMFRPTPWTRPDRVRPWADLKESTIDLSVCQSVWLECHLISCGDITKSPSRVWFDFQENVSSLSRIVFCYIVTIPPTLRIQT